VPSDIILTRSKVADFFIRNIKHLHRFAPRVSRHPDGGNLIVLCQLSTRLATEVVLWPMIQMILALEVLNGRISSSIISATRLVYLQNKIL